MLTSLLLHLLSLHGVNGAVTGCHPPPPAWAPKTVCTGSDTCTAFPCTPESVLVPESDRPAPLYPQQFQCDVRGFLVYPFTSQWWHVDIAQEAGTKMYYDGAREMLKFHNRVPIVFGAHAVTDFIHGPGEVMHALGYGTCFCTNIGVGILTYNAFHDAEYLGREQKFIEYINEVRLTDHYLKGPHHIWFDVATGLPIRAWQPSNGLQVYSDWSVGQPSASEFSVPESCFKVNCTKAKSADAILSARSQPAADIIRAQTRLPGSHLQGSSFSHMGEVLNRHLKHTAGLKWKDCEDFGLVELQAVARTVLSYTRSDFQALYAARRDRRQLILPTEEDVLQMWTQQADAPPLYREISRDGLCHETVMWYAHHVPDAKKPQLHDLVTLPLLPLIRHTASPEMLNDPQGKVIWEHYEKQAGCGACHVQLRQEY